MRLWRQWRVVLGCLWAGVCLPSWVLSSAVCDEVYNQFCWLEPSTLHLSSRWAARGAGYVDRFVVFGGYQDELGYVALDDTWIYDIRDEQWDPIRSSTPPHARAFHTLTQMGNTSASLLFGGEYRSAFSTVYLNDLWMFDFETTLWRLLSPSGPIPPPRAQHTCVSTTDTRLVCYGGVSYNETALGDLWSYSVSLNEWSPLNATAGASSLSPVFATATRQDSALRGAPVPGLPAPRSQHVSFCLDDPAVMFVAGGVSESGQCNERHLDISAITSDLDICWDTWRLNLTSLEWTRLPSELPTPIVGMTAVKMVDEHLDGLVARVIGYTRASVVEVVLTFDAQPYTVLPDLPPVYWHLSSHFISVDRLLRVYDTVVSVLHPSSNQQSQVHSIGGRTVSGADFRALNDTWGLLVQNTETMMWVNESPPPYSPPFIGAGRAPVDNDTIYIFGGQTLTLPNTDELWHYSISSNVVSRITLPAIALVPSQRFGLAMAQWDFEHSFIVFGGGRRAEFITYNDTWLFNTTAVVWLPLATRPALSDTNDLHWPPSRFLAASVSCLDRVRDRARCLAVFGGFHADHNDTRFNLLGDLWILEDHQWRYIVTPSSLSVPPEYSSEASLVYLAFDTCLYLYGGLNRSSEPSSQFFRICNLFPTNEDEKSTQPTWDYIETLPNSPGALYSHSSTSAGLLMLIYGGIGPGLTESNRLFAYNTVLSQWHILHSATAPLRVPIEVSGLYGASMFLDTSTVAAPSVFLTVLGGIFISSSSDAYPGTVGTVHAACPTGFYAPHGFFAERGCAACRAGTYNDVAGESMCTSCPVDSWTREAGGNSRNSCVVCNPNMCSGHGSCTLDAKTFVGTCHCDALFFFSETCHIPVSGLIIFIVPVVVALLSLLFVCTRSKVKAQVTETELRRLLMEDQLEQIGYLDAQLNALGHTAIREEEITFEKKLASGAAGEVFQARWRKRRVAVKVLRSAMVEGDPEMLNEFAKEVHTLRTVRHEHIVDFFGVGVRSDSHVPYMVIELMPQGSLRSLLDSDKPLSIEAAINFAFQCANGMRYLHFDFHRNDGHYILHCDLKGANLLVRGDRLKISDLGTAQLLTVLRREGATEFSQASGTVAQSDGGITFDGPFIGTIRFQAPESFRTKELRSVRVDRGVDVYAFAMCMYELMTRSIPLVDVREWDIPTVVCAGERPVVNALLEETWPAAWTELMRACWAHQPNSRPTFINIVAILSRILSS